MKNQSEVISAFPVTKKLTHEQRVEIGKLGAKKHWDPSIPIAVNQGILHIGDKQIDCVVTENGDRILSMTTVFETFGRTCRGYKRANREIIMPPFLDALNLTEFISPELKELCSPVEYRNLKGKLSKGYKAQILPQICMTYLNAEISGKITHPSQIKMSRVCHVIIGALSTVGIIALVDEATGFQQDRTKDALGKILNAFIAKELQPWTSTVPLDYYKELFRLRGIENFDCNVKKPWHFGHITNNVLYSRLAPGVLEELKRVCPRNEKGALKHRYFQKLTENTGYLKFTQHLASVVSVMKLSDDYNDFMEKLDRIHPKRSMDELEEIEGDTGKGL